jgi:hypothetical protein
MVIAFFGCPLIKGAIRGASSTYFIAFIFDGPAGKIVSLAAQIDPARRQAQVILPTLHPDQVRLFRMPGRRKAARCGRRWGKNKLGETVIASDLLRGRWDGWFADKFDRLSESYQAIKDVLTPVLKRSVHNKIIETVTGGKVDFWSLDDPSAGRSRKYHRIIVDEAAFAPPGSIEIWKRSIEPTLLDYQGAALVMSNTNGIDPSNMMWQFCNNPTLGFVDFHAPTHNNPLIPIRYPNETLEAWQARRDLEFETLKKNTEPLVFQQEYLADFVDFSGAAFFALDNMLEDGQPVDFPVRCEAVFATIDSAVKTGRENDGTGVIFAALMRNNVRLVGPDGKMQPLHRVIILDWDLIQIEGAMLEAWLPNVFKLLQDYAAQCSAAQGSLGAFIEDKSSGSILIQQARNRGWPAHAIESDLTKVGKDERAISVSGYVYRKLVKLSRYAFEKTTNYHGTTRNHLRGQVVGFRPGNKDSSREDDLLDCFTYLCAIALGNADGF